MNYGYMQMSSEINVRQQTQNNVKLHITRFRLANVYEKIGSRV